MATLRDTAATSALNEDKYINKLYEGALSSQNNAIKQGYEQSGKQLTSGQQQTKKLTDAYLHRTKTEAPGAGSSMLGTPSLGGFGIGGSSQAALSFGNQQQQNVGQLNAQQNAADMEFERRRKLLADQYATEIKKAQANNDMERAQMLYEAAKAEEEQLRKFRQQGGSLMAGKGDNSILESILSGAGVPRDTTSETWDSVLKNEDSINKIYEAMIQGQQLEAQADRDKALSELEADQRAAQRQTDADLTQAYVDALRSGKNYQETQSAYGQGSGVAAQAQIARANELTKDLTDLRRLQSSKDAELEGQRLDVVEGYGKTVSDAISEANSQRVKDLYEAAEKEEQALVDDQLFAGQILAGQGDYSVLGKLYGLTQEQIDKLNGKGSGGGSSGGGYRGSGSGGGNNSGSESSSSSRLGSWYDWANNGGPPSLGDFVQMPNKKPSASKPSGGGKPTGTRPSAGKN